MIVSLDELKRVLGLDLEDTSEDENLTRLIAAKTTWVEGETKRRFDTPIPHTQYTEGTGECEMYLEWHVDDSPEADNPSESLDPTTAVKVFRRPRWERWRAWEELIEGEDWERRGQTLLAIHTLSVWPREDEFKMEYLGGYALAPEDIKEVVLELSMNQYLMDISSSSGTAGITSEHLGDFSYTVDLGAVATGTGGTSENSTKTLNRYKRKFV
jgi:hypothetical protein